MSQKPKVKSTAVTKADRARAVKRNLLGKQESNVSQMKVTDGMRRTVELTSKS